MPSLLLRNPQGVGDAVMVSALMRDLTSVGFAVDVFTGYMPIFRHNPNRVNLPRHDLEYEVRLDLNTFQRAEREGWHLIEVIGDDLNKAMGLSIPFRPLPQMFLGDDELEPPAKSYCAIVAGGKKHLTTKLYPHYQRVVDLTPDIHWVQIGSPTHFHPGLTGVTDMRCDDLRGFVRLIAHADLILCPVTSAMHIAAAFGKKAVIINGGREAECAIRYPEQAIVSNFLCGAPCWQDRCHVFDDDPGCNARLCPLPILINGTNYPQCMVETSPDEIAAKVMGLLGYIPAWHSLAS
jgi:hypothetical protein